MSPLSERSLISPGHRAVAGEPGGAPADVSGGKRGVTGGSGAGGTAGTGGSSRQVGDRQRAGPARRALDTRRKPPQAPFGVRAQDDFFIRVKLMTSTLQPFSSASPASGHVQRLQRSQGHAGSCPHSCPTRTQPWGLHPGSSRCPELCLGIAPVAPAPAVCALQAPPAPRLPKLPRPSTARTSALC